MKLDVCCHCHEAAEIHSRKDQALKPYCSTGRGNEHQYHFMALWLLCNSIICRRHPQPDSPSFKRKPNPLDIPKQPPKKIPDARRDRAPGTAHLSALLRRLPFCFGFLFFLSCRAIKVCVFSYLAQVVIIGLRCVNDNQSEYSG